MNAKPQEQHKQNKLPVLAGCLGWIIAAIGTVYNYSSFSTRLAAACGAGTAALFASVFFSPTSRQARKMSGLKTIFCLVACVLSMSGLSWFISWLGNLWSPFSIYWNITIAESVDMACKAFTGVLLLRVICLHIPWAGALEALGAALLFSYATSPHRSSITHPFWLVDLFVEHGWQAPDAFWIVGGLAALVAALVLFSHTSFRVTLPTAFIFILVLTLFFGAAVYFSTVFPPAPLLVPPPPDPPKDRFPETPPPPQPFAVVELLDYYQPTERLGAYYFRTHYYSRLEKNELLETLPGEQQEQNLATEEVLPDRELAIQFPETAWKYEGSDFEENLQREFATVRARIHHLDRPERPLCLISTIEYQPVDVTDQRFQLSYEVTALPPGKIADDLRIASIRQEFGKKNWTPELLQYYTHSPDDPQLAKLKTEILQSLQAMYADLPGARLGVLRNWINESLTFSARSESKRQESSLSEFLFGDRIGGAKLFSLAAVVLFRSAGIPSRMVAGYRYPISKDEIKSELLLTDAHATYWPEVYLRGSGWVPVPLNPVNVIDRPQPSSEHDLEQLLSQIARSSQQEQAPTFPPLRFPQEALWYGLVLLLFVTIGTNFWRRWLSLRICRAQKLPSLTYRAAIDLVAIAGFQRQYNQMREEFAQQISHDDPVMAKHFAELTGMYTVFERNAFEHPRKTWLRVLKELGREVTRLWWKNFRTLLWTFVHSRSGGRELWQNLNPFCWRHADLPKPERYKPYKYRQQGNILHGNS